MEETVRRHFEPLLDSSFSDILRRHYPNGVTVRGRWTRTHRRRRCRSERVPIAIRLGRRRTPSALGYVERNGFIRADREGIAISTFGKVIKRGWDWLGLTPTGHGRITGLIEASDLAACLTLSKNDFIRSGARGATYLAYRKAIQEVVSRQLAAWGDRHDGEARPRMARLERDLERVLEDLAEDFPLLRSLVDRRAGGQKRLPMPGRGGERVPAPLFADVPVGDEPSDAVAGSGSRGVSAVSGEPATSTPEPSVPRHGSRDPGEVSPRSASQSPLTRVTLTPMRRRPAPSTPWPADGGRRDTGCWCNSNRDRVSRNSVVSSTARSGSTTPIPPTRVPSDRDRLGYHTALTVALALAPLAVEPSQEHSFITQFLAQWGGALRPASDAAPATLEEVSSAEAPEGTQADRAASPC